MTSVNRESQPDWKQVENLFLQAVALPVEQRDGFLRQHCGDQAPLYREVASLVASHESMDTERIADSISADVGLELRGLVDQLQEETLTPALREQNDDDGQRLIQHLRNELTRYQPDFQVTDVISRGGTGVVFRVDQASLDREVAVKVLLAGRDDERMRRRFVRESKATARVRHGNIVDIFAVEETPDLVYLVMELIDGPSLKQWIIEKGQLAPDQAALIASQVAAGLQAAHEQNLVHRDVKPANVMLQLGAGSESVQAKLIDFGIFRNLEGEQQTLDQMVVGTPAYMSPEQLFSPETADARSDVYGLGITLYEMLTGTRPFRGAPHMIMKQVESQDALPPRRLDDRIPRDLESVCLKAIQPAPDRRYASAGEMAQDLQRFLNREPTLARPVPRLEKLIRWGRRNARLAAAIAVTTLLACCLVAGSLFFALTVNSMNQALLQERQRTFQSRLAAVLDAEPGALQSLIESLNTERPELVPELQAARDSPSSGLNRRLNAALTLAIVGHRQSAFLIERLDQVYVSPESCGNLLTALQHDNASRQQLLDSLATSTLSTEQAARRIILLAFLGELSPWQRAAANRNNPTLATEVVHLLPKWHGQLDQLIDHVEAEREPASYWLALRGLGEIDSRSLSQSTVERLVARLQGRLQRSGIFNFPRPPASNRKPAGGRRSRSAERRMEF